MISDATVCRKSLLDWKPWESNVTTSLPTTVTGSNSTAAGYDKWLPEGVRISYATDEVDCIQQNIAGYDPDHYMDMALTLPGFSVDNPTARRSYAAQFITKQVNKLINLPVLKDHQSAGVTMCLKNLSHGLVNNVSRSHSSPSLNACNSFIPAVVALPVIRNKAVLISSTG